MYIKIWGVRGSIPTPGETTLKYGGNTLCIEVRNNNNEIIVIDAGTGIRPLGNSLMGEFKMNPMEILILLSHTHWDHIQGIPFFVPIYLPQNCIKLKGPSGTKKSLKYIMKIQMEHDFFPLNFEGLQSNIQCEQIKEDKFTYKGFTIESHLLNHGGLGAVLGYKIKADGKSFTFVCDHEGYDLIYSGNSEKTKKVLEKVMEGYNNFIKDSDLLIHDSQYTDEEYEQKKNWGHSTFNYVLNKALKCNIKKVGFIHYDPMYDDKKLDSIFEELNSKIKDSKLEIVGCIENQKIEL